MEKVINVAGFICEEYQRQSGEPIDELKLQKLIYFAQRESLAILNQPMFSESLEGWIHGPVSLIARQYFADGSINTTIEDIKLESKRIISNVIEQFGHLASWKLRDLSHEEISWQRSRIGLNPDSRGNRSIIIDDIYEDSKKVRPFDYTWGMYIDEFEDIERNIC